MSLNAPSVTIDAPEFVAELERWPNPNALLSAYRSELISEQTLFRLLPDDRPTRIQRMLDAARDVILGPLASIKSF